MGSNSAGFRRVVVWKRLVVIMAPILTHTAKDNGAQCLSASLRGNYSPMLINFTTEANNGAQASYTTEVMKQKRADKRNLARSCCRAAVGRGELSWTAKRVLFERTGFLSLRGTEPQLNMTVNYHLFSSQVIKKCTTSAVFMYLNTRTESLGSSDSQLDFPVSPTAKSRFSITLMGF